MRLKSFQIRNYRSAENIKLSFPDKKPVVLFGPNNVGKSNILKALDVMFGEKYTTYYDFQDSDYFSRDKDLFPIINYIAEFDEEIYAGNNYNSSTNTICFSTNYPNAEGGKEHQYHYSSGKKIFLKNDDREKCQFILIDATRDIHKHFSYGSQYSILSKMSKKMHEALISSSKDKLTEQFENIKEIFEGVPEYRNFYSSLKESFAKNIDGFEHALEIDFSAYDPNNYFRALRIVAKDGNEIRAFDEFGTGEQQILLLSFMQAYAKTFKGGNFILGIEEPEAHLHPLAQRWLARHIQELAYSGIQVIITTHSPEFLNIDGLEGFIKVYKNKHITQTVQHNADSLTNHCLSLNSHPEKTNSNSIFNFYKVNTFYDQLAGFFARKIILVEGETEFFAFYLLFRNSNFDLIKSGIELVNCRGKQSLARNYRLFTAYKIPCYCVFDADGKISTENEELAALFDFNQSEISFDQSSYNEGKHYGCFGHNFEQYLRANYSSYAASEQQLEGMTKVMKAKVIIEANSELKPEFIKKIAMSLAIEELKQTENIV